MMNDTAARISFAEHDKRASTLTIPPAVETGRTGAENIVLEHLPDGTIVVWHGERDEAGALQPRKVFAPIPAGLLFDLLIRRPKPPADAAPEEPYASLAEHIEARTVELRTLSDRADAAGVGK